MSSAWKRVNQSLTRNLIKSINGLPAPVKTLIGALPGGGIATSSADNLRWYFINAAERLHAKGKLSPDALRAMNQYKISLQREQRAYESFLRALQKDM